MHTIFEFRSTMDCLSAQERFLDWCGDMNAHYRYLRRVVRSLRSHGGKKQKPKKKKAKKQVKKE